MERQKFEGSFRQAFHEAEVAPSESVWINVELDLEKASGGQMKRRLLFFQLLAAASMVFAMGTGAIYYLNGLSGDDQTIALQTGTTQPADSPSNNNLSLPEKNTVNDTMQSGTGSTSASSESENESNSFSAGGSGRSVHSNSTPSRGSSSQLILNKESAGVEPLQAANSTGKIRNERNVADRRPTSRLIDFEQPALAIPVSEPDPGMVLLARLQDEERKYTDEKPVIKERTWASFGVGAGSFNPQASASPPPAQKGFGIASGGPKMSSSNPTAGASYSVGVGMAGKISKRVVLQGGISYLTQNAEFTSSAAVGQNASLNELAVTSDDLVPTSPYKVNSNLQYLSVPVQAGYLLLDRSFGIQVNGGFATDLFLQNTLTPADKSLDKVTQGAGSDSPYRTVNFTGLVGTEFSYKLADHYRIAVSPGLRYALNSIYKSEIDTEMSPMTFDVSVRFRYIFK